MLHGYKSGSPVVMMSVMPFPLSSIKDVLLRDPSLIHKVMQSHRFPHSSVCTVAITYSIMLPPLLGPGIYDGHRSLCSPGTTQRVMTVILTWGLRLLSKCNQRAIVSVEVICGRLPMIWLKSLSARQSTLLDHPSSLTWSDYLWDIGSVSILMEWDKQNSLSQFTDCNLCTIASGHFFTYSKTEYLSQDLLLRFSYCFI